MNKKILIFILMFLLFTPLTPSSYKGTIEQNLAPPSLIQLHWIRELIALAEAYEHRRETVIQRDEREQRSDKEHDGILERELKNAILLAPTSKPAVCLGAGSLREFSGEVLELLFRNEKFPVVYLLDINIQATRAAVINRGFSQELLAGKIKLIQADLSMIEPSFIAEVEAIAEKAKTRKEAKQELIKLYKEKGKEAVKLKLPPPLKRKEAGLVVSATLVPSMESFVILAIERTVAQKAKRLKLLPPTGLKDSIFFNQPGQINYDKAVSSLTWRMEKTHAQFLRELTAEEGIIYFSGQLAYLYRKKLREPMTEVVQALRNYARVASKLILGKPRAATLVRSLVGQFRDSPNGASIRWTLLPAPVLNCLIQGENSPWVGNTEVLSTNVWTWLLDQGVEILYLMQSLLMKQPKLSQSDEDPLSSLKRKMALRETVSPVEIFEGLKNGLDFERVEQVAQAKGLGAQTQSQELLSELNAQLSGLKLTSPEIQAIFEELGIQKGESVLEIGPGYTLLNVIAAIMGAKVTVVEPEPKYHVRLQGIKIQVEELIRLSGGELKILTENILDEGVQEKLKDNSFDHVIALDVISYPQFLRRYSRDKQKMPWLLRAALPDPKEAREISNIIARVKKANTGTVFVSVNTLTNFKAKEKNIVFRTLREVGLIPERRVWVSTPTVCLRLVEQMDHGIIYQFGTQEALRVQAQSPTQYSL